ncbi:carbohydrate-binding protein [Haliovirga abyssi]|uniref:Fibronectin type-III domain-containing protein n=1 Tax=Haliovirga abyssi TaxID=2996794 RepID=A0AAU9D2J1_9FUSO|nr:carbohydrate-binding protein [Haliovirga abyssi]BDU50216.1 hypothetical protein HLVA_07850 [Haliovirga abyssi]
MKRIKTTLYVLLFLSINLLGFGNVNKELVRLEINETARGFTKDQVWKKIPFTVPYETEIKITVIASTDSNGKRNDDDLKWALDENDFGWATERAWDGRTLNGKKKTVVVTTRLNAGDHYLKFWADQTPTLYSIKIEYKAKNTIKELKMKDYRYIDGMGIKLLWEPVEKANGYKIFKKSKKYSKYSEVAEVKVPFFMDAFVTPGDIYDYKIAVLNKAKRISFYSKSMTIEVSEKIPPKVVSDLKVISKKGVVYLDWNQNTEPDFASYNIYRKGKNDLRYSKYAIALDNRYEDKKASEMKKYSYRITAVDMNGNESGMSKEVTVLVKPKFYRPQGVGDIYPKEFYPGDTITIYFSPRKSTQIRKRRLRAKRRDPKIRPLPKQMYVHYGLNNWDPDYTIAEAKDPKMTYDKSISAWKYEMKVPIITKEIDFVFKDELDNWDTNWSKDYKYKAAKDKVPPSAPTKLTSIPKYKLVYLEWAPNEEADLSYYKIFRSSTKNGKFVPITAKLKSNYYRDIDLTPRSTHFYKIKAYDVNDNESEFSNMTEAKVLEKGIELNKPCTWNPKVPGMGEKVKIYYSQHLGALKESKKVMIKIGVNDWDTLKKPIKNYDMKYDKILDGWYYEYNVEPGVYTVNVAFTDGLLWDTNFGMNWNIKVMPDKEPPTNVVGLKAIPEADRINLLWKANTEKDLAGYNVYKNGNKLNNALIKEAKYEDVAVESGVDLNYSVTAVDMYGNESIQTAITTKTLRDIITVPETVYMSTLANNRLRLIASFDTIVAWEIKVVDSNGNLVNKFNGRGSNAIAVWYLNDINGKRIKVGKYKYIVSVMGDESIMKKEVQIQIIK